MAKTKKRLTVDALLHMDDISDLLKDLYDKRADIDQFVLIYTDKDGTGHFYWQGTNERIVYILEQGKLKIMVPSDDDNG